MGRGTTAAGPPAWAATTYAARHNPSYGCVAICSLGVSVDRQARHGPIHGLECDLPHPGGVERWGTDERFNDLKHLNRAGAAGWQVYDRGVITVPNEPHRLYAVTYSMRRMVS